MTDTVRTVAALQALLADNQVPGSITPQTIRDLLVSGTPIVADNTARTTLFPSPTSDARVYNKTSHQIERYDSTRAAWIGETVSPFYDFGKLGTAAPMPGTQRLIGLPAATPPNTNNRLLGQPLCATATVTSQIKTTNQVDFSISGQVYRKAANDNFWTLSGTTVAVSSWQKWLLLVDSSGAASVEIGTPSLVSAAAVQLPGGPPSGKCVFGTLTVATDASHTFIPGSTLLGAAGITATFVDGLDSAYDVAVASPSILMGAASGATQIASSTFIASVLAGPIINTAVPWRYLCGNVTPTATQLRVVGATVQATVSTGAWFAVEFEIDCTQFEFQINANGAGDTWRMLVDGQWTNQTLQDGSPSGGAPYRFLVTFPSRAVRSIRLEFGCRINFWGLNVGPNDTAWTPSAPVGPRVICYGDSFVAGTGPTTTTANFVNTLGKLMGWRDIWSSGQGGSGYLAVTSGVTFRARCATDIIAYSPDIVIIYGGKNDIGAFSSTLVGAEAQLLYAQIRAGLPNVKLIVIGPNNLTGSPDANTVAIRDALRTALTAGDPTGPNLFIDPVVATVAGANTLGWSTGTGKAGATTGSGNGDLYVISDGVHPTQAGHDYLARRMASAIAAAMPF